MKIYLASVVMLYELAVAAPLTRVAGTVRDANTGLPVQRAVVAAIQKPPINPIKGPLIVQSRTDGSGAYSLELPPNSSFALCVGDLIASLDPCAWGTPPTVTTSSSTLRVDIPVEPAVRISLQISGLKTVVASQRKLGKGPQPHFANIVTRTGSLKPMPVTSESDSDVVVSILAPARQNLVVRLNDQVLQFGDAKGKPLLSRDIAVRTETHTPATITVVALP